MDYTRRRSGIMLDNNRKFKTMRVLYLRNYEHVGPSGPSFMATSEIPASTSFVLDDSTTNRKELLC